ncbi:MAG: hypothetical protein ABSE64_08095 [Vulcanimicrobiaceae bacterium]
MTGVDIDLKKVNGQQTDTACILVFVRKKGEFQPADEIPKFISGIPTDIEEAVFVKYTMTIQAGIDRTRYDPCKGGAAIMPARITDAYGSLGILVTDSTTTNKVWLSAYHVLCVDSHWNDPGVDKSVTQPAIALGGRKSADTIGAVLRGTYGQVDVPWGFDLYIDAAICSSVGRATDPNVIRIGAPRGARNAQIASLVAKYGATTERTSGQVVSTNATVNIDGTWFYYQCRVSPPYIGAPPFSQGGDSGAAVFDEDFYVIGLVIAGPATGAYTIVNPIGQIMENLNITVP